MNYQNIAIIVSSKDLAGLNIKNKLINNFEWEETPELVDKNKVYDYIPSSNNIKLYTIETDTIFREDIDKEIEADLFIFATRHSSASGKPTLSCHTPGNWGKAEYGGKEKTVCIAPADILKSFLLEMQTQVNLLDLSQEVSVEQTHHGPLISKPTAFIEIGSVEKDWQEPTAGIAIANTLIKILPKLGRQKEQNNPTGILLGGGHYNLTTNKLMFRTDYEIGHICAKFQLDDLTKESLSQAINAHTNKISSIILDWKGLGKSKGHLKKIIDEINQERNENNKEELEVLRAQNILKQYDSKQ